MTIAASLDLDKAIETFKNTTQKLLEMGESSEWDGQRLKEQEEKIRQASLELAGQSIGILLQRLSEEPLAQQQANQRTQSFRGFGSQSQGKKKVIVTTVGNVEVPLWIDYVLSRQPQNNSSKGKKQKKRGQRGKSKGQGFYPFLRWLGMTEKVTPLVWSTVTSFGMLSASFAVAWGNLKEWGIDLSEQRIERLTYRFGEVGIKLREEWLKQHQQCELPVGETLRGQRVVLSADGGRTRLRRAKKGKQRADGQRGYQGNWREPKLFTLYAIDEQGQRINTVALPVINDGTFEDVEGFMSLLEMYLVKMGIVQASQVLLIADGAIWIWQRIPALLKRLGLSDEQIIELIDFYHAAEHLRQFSEFVFGKTSQAKQWFETARSTLKHQSFATLLDEMQALAKATTSKRKQEKLHKQLQYFSEQPHRFAYEQVQALKLPIGSGCIESLIRQVVNLRLKGPGKFWLPEHAEIVLHGRCQWAAGQWHQFCQRVLTAGLAPKLASVLSFNPTELAAA